MDGTRVADEASHLGERALTLTRLRRCKSAHRRDPLDHDVGGQRLGVPETAFLLPGEEQRPLELVAPSPVGRAVRPQ